MSSSLWMSAGAGAAGVLTGWASAYIRHRVQSEVARLRTAELRDGLDNAVRALEAHTLATKERFESIDKRLWELVRSLPPMRQ